MLLQFIGYMFLGYLILNKIFGIYMKNEFGKSCFWFES